MTPIHDRSAKLEQMILLLQLIKETSAFRKFILILILRSSIWLKPYCCKLQSDDPLIPVRTKANSKPKHSGKKVPIIQRFLLV